MKALQWLGWLAGILCVVVDEGVAAQPVAPAPGSAWHLVMMVREGEEQVPPALVSLEFGEQGSVAGSAGVNRYTGQVRVGPDGALRWSARGLAATRMAGPPEAMAFETRYLHALMHAALARVGEDGRLVLVDAEGTRRLVFEPRR